MQFSIRPVDPDHDFPELAAMLDQVMTNGMTVGSLRASASIPSPINRNMVAAYEHGQIIGWSSIGRGENEIPTRAFTSTIAHPDYRRMGVGSALLCDVVDFAKSAGVNELKSRVKDSEPEWLEWAQAHGFIIERHSFRSSVTLAGFEDDSLAKRIKKLASDGITFTTLAKLGDTEADRRRYYEADSAAAIDIPGEDHVFSWAEYEAEVFKNESYRPEGAHVAMDGNRIVGVANVMLDAEHNRMENAFTGVLAEYRGRGIAQALKLMTIEYARKSGIAEILTENDSENAPMLAVNRKLGYKPWPGAYSLKAHIK
ncbi:MAG: GNAT family N-acetyltransferase [Chloroflexi bacterium]|nr:GNAT family N-acetyltransferase [Chloroflexota bacterium]